MVCTSGPFPKRVESEFTATLVNLRFDGGNQGVPLTNQAPAFTISSLKIPR